MLNKEKSGILLSFQRVLVSSWCCMWNHIRKIIPLHTTVC